MQLTPTDAPPAYSSSGSLDELNVVLSANPESKEVLVSLVPPKAPVAEKGVGKRAPLDICCVIDVSGSMGSDAPVPADPTTGKPAENSGLSVLDVVKHALRTIITTTQEDDRVALVTFHSSAQVVSKLTKMTIGGRDQILKAIEGLHPQGSTNLWDGLKTGMNLLNGSTNPTASTSDTKFPEHKSGRLSTLFILTDGMPNVEPPRGHIPMLQSYLDSHPSRFSISTFGFGYSLDSQLLLKIAKVGGGGYGFIPDAGLVGTVFVNAVANAYATYAPRARLDIEVPEGTFVQVKGGLHAEKTSWGVQIDIGDIQYGQSRDVVLSLGSYPVEVNAVASYWPWTSQQELKAVGTLAQANQPDLGAIAFHSARLDFVSAVFAIFVSPTGQNGPPAKSQVNAGVTAFKGVERDITTSPVLANDPTALALATDISGEGVLALQQANFDRWGRHYLPSLARSHQRQQCGNFKDPGLQNYGKDSPLFIEERNKLDAAFDDLPAPKPSNARGRPVKNVSMRVYNNYMGGCYTGDCLVTLAGGRQLRVDEVKRGMEVETPRGARKVAAIVRTAVPSGGTPLCRIGDLKITPWHPIVSNNQWVFPIDVVKPEVLACDAFYTIMLVPSPDVDAHSVRIAGLWCVTLGHGLTDPALANGDVRAHGFFGNYERVLRSVSSLTGFETEGGVARCVGAKRNSIDGRICGFVDEEAPAEKDELHARVSTALRA